MRSEDPTVETVRTFEEHAARYGEKHLTLREYDRFYERILKFLPDRGASLDAVHGDEREPGVHSMEEESTWQNKVQ